MNIRMKKKNQMNYMITVFLLAAFGLWTLAIQFVDVQAIGPNGSSVGFASLNGFIHRLTGVHLLLYTITDWLSIIPLLFVPGFAFLGFMQLIKRKSLLKVDYSLLLLGGFYLVVMAAYILFEIVTINFRPVLMNGHLEASYPSSTTMLVLCVMPTAIMQFKLRIKNKIIRKALFFLMTAFTLFMVVCRFISGVHWFTDIIGGILLSSGLVMLYYSLLKSRLS